MKKLILTGIVLSLFACAPADGPHKPVGENGPEGEFSTGGYDEVKPIFAKYCSACHPSRSGPNWLDFAQASTYAKNGKLLRRAGLERSMPPPGSAQAAQLSESERLAIVNWAKAGGPRNSMAGNTKATAAQSEPSPQQRLIQTCLHCHGASGPDPSAQPRIPVLAGQNREYLAEQLHRFKWRDRVDPSQTLSQSMNDIALDLTDAQIEEAAKYFSSQESHVGAGEKGVPLELKGLYLHGEYVARRDCNSCHRNRENNNRPTSPRLPALSGQSRVYLINQLIYFRDNERSNPAMREYASGLTNQDIEALATYFSYVR